MPRTTAGADRGTPGREPDGQAEVLAPEQAARPHGQVTIDPPARQHRLPEHGPVRPGESQVDGQPVEDLAHADVRGGSDLHASGVDAGPIDGELHSVHLRGPGHRAPPSSIVAALTLAPP